MHGLVPISLDPSPRGPALSTGRRILRALFQAIEPMPVHEVNVFLPLTKGTGGSHEGTARIQQA